MKVINENITLIEMEIIHQVGTYEHSIIVEEHIDKAWDTVLDNENGIRLGIKGEYNFIEFPKQVLDNSVKKIKQIALKEVRSDCGEHWFFIPECLTKLEMLDSESTIYDEELFLMLKNERKGKREHWTIDAYNSTINHILWNQR
ncbi:MAG: hypothetical protein N4A45_10380 [Flavobacteriales bacterium]|jgi:hypothetical protein|nr:hypothetical protein [Flavobacteriales bacterium]